jgi:CRISPR/Cas system-associated exonuclease Cas4 (RecB family)
VSIHISIGQVLAEPPKDQPHQVSGEMLMIVLKMYCFTKRDVYLPLSLRN